MTAKEIENARLFARTSIRKAELSLNTVDRHLIEGDSKGIAKIALEDAIADLEVALIELELLDEPPLKP